MAVTGSACVHAPHINHHLEWARSCPELLDLPPDFDPRSASALGQIVYRRLPNGFEASSDTSRVRVHERAVARLQTLGE